MKITKLVRRWMSAAKAGWIASNCPLCIIDDDEEAIIPCHVHEDAIAELAKINEANSK
jgi:hypothetical protein